MQTAKRIRFLGWGLLLIGLFLVALMGTITYNLAPNLLQPGVINASGSRFTGTIEQARLIFVLFGAVIGFGLMSMVSGLWQIITGKRNKWMVVIMLAVFVLIVLSAIFASRAFGS